MLGPAELREINEAFNEYRRDLPASEGRGPYISSSFAAGLAVTRAVAGNLKTLAPFPATRDRAA